MWCGTDGVVRPDLFKRFLGEYNVTFQGYGQHDSQECINTILDLMSEDLFKRNKKPYVETPDSEGKTDAVASFEAWNKHLIRNQSYIVDLFHGQYKSKLTCSQCNRISITFEPYMMVSVPIVTVNYVDVDGYMMKYTIDDNYQNFKFKIRMKDNQTLYDVRLEL